MIRYAAGYSICMQDSCRINIANTPCWNEASDNSSRAKRNNYTELQRESWHLLLRHS